MSDEKPPHQTTKFGHFIQTYSSFLSSFVIGVAGLIATSVWQYRQSQTAERQAISEQAIAKTKADNDWRITRADILSKNLNVLSTQGPSTADQRFGVLLSLTRGAIIDPELAVSYALELGKDNASYMRSVLESTTNKNYTQLLNGFKLTCLQRFGVEKTAEICKDDALSDRSDAIAQVIQDEMTAAVTAGKAAEGPLSLLRDEREVQDAAGRLSWLFEPYLQDLYERRQWQEIEHFETASTGARLVAALVLATARTGELLSPTEAAALDKFHAERRKWLAGYVFGPSCEPECRGKLIDVMLSSFGEAQGDYDDPMRRLLRESRSAAGATIGHLHARLLWCQIDGGDLVELRDRVLVPAFLEALGDPHADPGTLEDIAGIVALVPAPEASDAKDFATWKTMLTAVAKANEKVQRTFTTRRTSAARERMSPPPMIKKVDFCNAAAPTSVPSLLMTAAPETRPGAGRTVLDMNGYQWTVLFAAWLGWGFDVFDGLLFNYVAPNCVPTLLGLTIGSPEAKKATLLWGGILTSILLLGWAAGGIIFGQIADRIGRTRTLMLTMLLYALGTASCAAAPNIWVLMLCRVVGSLGIGGEWAAGAAMVAEVVPEKRRVEAGALLYTSAPMGLFLATFVNFKIAGVLFKGSPETSWRYVFLCGLIPAAVAFVVRMFVKEPDRWKQSASGATHPRIGELFTKELWPLTRSGLSMAIIALIAWWGVNAFIPTVSTGLAQVTAKARGLDRAGTLALVEGWKALATNVFNLGGLIGTLLTIPAAKVMGRRTMFTLYYFFSGVAILATFGLDLAPLTRLYMYFFIGLTIFGVFGSFTYYLPELFPTRLRGTGAGFCYNAGRVVAAGGPFLVGAIASRGADALGSALHVLFWIGVVPLIGVVLSRFAIETRDRPLA